MRKLTTLIMALTLSFTLLANQTKVKIFVNHSVSKIEQEINSFLGNNRDIEVIGIQWSVDDACSAILLYKLN